MAGACGGFFIQKFAKVLRMSGWKSKYILKGVARQALPKIVSSATTCPGKGFCDAGCRFRTLWGSCQLSVTSSCDVVGDEWTFMRRCSTWVPRKINMESARDSGRIFFAKNDRLRTKEFRPQPTYAFKVLSDLEVANKRKQMNEKSFAPTVESIGNGKGSWIYNKHVQQEYGTSWIVLLYRNKHGEQHISGRQTGSEWNMLWKLNWEQIRNRWPAIHGQVGNHCGIPCWSLHLGCQAFIRVHCRSSFAPRMRLYVTICFESGIDNSWMPFSARI